MSRKVWDAVRPYLHDTTSVDFTGGGEPLLQRDVLRLLQELVNENFNVLLETNGSLALDEIPEKVTIILDYKLHGSGMTGSMNLENLRRLRPSDEVKMVISDREDFDEAVRVTKEYRLCEKTHVLFSPAYGRIKPEDLAEWILEEHLAVRLNLQIHKYIWEPTARGR